MFSYNGLWQEVPVIVWPGSMPSDEICDYIIWGFKFLWKHRWGNALRLLNKTMKHVCFLFLLWWRCPVKLPALTEKKTMGEYYSKTLGSNQMIIQLLAGWKNYLPTKWLNVRVAGISDTKWWLVSNTSTPLENCCGYFVLKILHIKPIISY